MVLHQLPAREQQTAGQPACGVDSCTCPLAVALPPWCAAAAWLRSMHSRLQSSVGLLVGVAPWALGCNVFSQVLGAVRQCVFSNTL